MKIIGIREAQQQMTKVIRRAQKEPILFTRHGKPVAVIRGVQGQDYEDILLANDPKFWQLIEARRHSTERLVSHEAMMKEALTDLNHEKHALPQMVKPALRRKRAS